MRSTALIPVVLLAALVILVVFLSNRDRESRSDLRAPTSPGIVETSVPDTAQKEEALPLPTPASRSFTSDEKPQRAEADASAEGGAVSRPTEGAGRQSGEAEKEKVDEEAAPGEAAASKKPGYFTDASVPLTERKEEIGRLAEKGDDEAIEALMALGDSDSYLNFAAVEALGNIKNAAGKQRIVNYLSGKLAAQDLKVLSAAIRSYGELRGGQAVPELAELIRRNRVREDGFEYMVLTAAVRTLRRIGSRDAVPILSEELERSEQKGWSLEYGSELVEALDAIGSEESRKALLAYAERLSARVPDDPLAGTYFRQKISEAEAAAGKR